MLSFYSGGNTNIVMSAGDSKSRYHIETNGMNASSSGIIVSGPYASNSAGGVIITPRSAQQ